MPIIKSAIERVRVNEKAAARNASQMSAMRTAIKKFDKAKLAGADNLDDLYKIGRASCRERVCQYV